MSEFEHPEKRLEREPTAKQAEPWLEAATTPFDNPRITAKGSLPRSLRSTRYAAASE